MDADSCSCCRFYHGASGIVCALHPSGPVEDACGDWMPGDDLKRLNRLELLQCYAAGQRVFRRANLSRLDLSWIDLREANFTGSDFSGTNLQGTNLSHTDLSRTSLHRANLRGANLSRAWLNEVDLTGADIGALRQSLFSVRPDFRGATMPDGKLWSPWWVKFLSVSD